MAKINCTLYFDTDSEKYFIEKDGESVEISIKKTTTTRKKKTVVDDDPVAKITLTDNKYVLNNAAVQLLGVEPDMKLEIKYEKSGFTETPHIGINTAFGTDGGNRVTKTFTVSCRGKQNERLSQFGDVFELEAHPTKEGIFIMKGNKEVSPEIPEEVKEEIQLPDDCEFSLDELDDNKDVTEISSSDLDFSL